MLCQQSLSPTKVIVVDDGSEGSETVVTRYQQRLNLFYDWRPNDHSLALSRNRGAALAQSDILVFVDSDLLLNPRALAAYQLHLKDQPRTLLYGYMGSNYELQAPSAFLPHRLVNWLDKRYHWDGQQIKPTEALFVSSYEHAYGGNFALYRETYQALGGFDARFKGWGGEDLDFADRAVLQGFEVHFLLDAWGEHQVHSRQEAFHLQPAESRAHFYTFRPHPPLPYRVFCLGTSTALADLETKLKTVYNKAEETP